MNIKERFELTLEIIKANRGLPYTFMMSFRDYGDVPVFICDKIILAKLGTPSHIPNALATTVNSFRGQIPAIIINTAMSEFEHLDAILAHELGHHKLGHIDSLNKSWKRFIPGYRSERFEFEADAFAKNQGYDMAVMLEVLREVTPFSGAKRELNKRIARIK